jgi:membrane protease subunit HflK
MYIETVENVLSRTRKVVVDENASKGNMLYLPLDKLIERREGEGAGTRSSVTVEAEPASSADARQRVER